MPQESSSFVATHRFVARMVRPPAWTRTRSYLMVYGALFLIGLVDYLTGSEISLRVFYEIPIILCTLWLGWRAAVVCVHLSVGIWLYANYLAGAAYVRHPTIILNSIFLVAMYLILVWLVNALISLQRSLELKVAERTASLEYEVLRREQLQNELLQMEEKERGTTGHELHDGLCQHLVGTAFAAQVLKENLEAEGNAHAADSRRIVQLIEQGIAQTRMLARGLLLVDIRPEDFLAEMRALADSTTRVERVECQLILVGSVQVPDRRVASHLFRIAQEAIRNAVRHAKPSLIEVRLGHESGYLVLTITDNGKARVPSTRGDGMGLRIMRHRAELLKGQLSVVTSTAGGTSVCCRLPGGWATTPETSP